MNNVLDEYFSLSDSLFLEVREGKVPRTDSIASLLKVLDQIAEEYRSQDSLPKELVGVMLDTSTALYSAANAHPEPARSQLYKQFDIVTDKMRDLCL